MARRDGSRGGTPQRGARDAAEDLAGRVKVEVQPLVDRATAGTADLVATAGPLVETAVETVSGVLEDAGVRGAAAWDALRGQHVVPVTAPGRRWPWAVGAAVAGAAAAAVVNYAVVRLRTTDAPDALEPEQVEAVVDRPEDAPPLG